MIRPKNALPAYLNISSCASPLVFDEGRAIRRVVTATVLPVMLFIDTPDRTRDRPDVLQPTSLREVKKGATAEVICNLVSTQITGRRARRHSTSGNFEWLRQRY